MSVILFITSEDFEQCKEVGILGPGSLVGEKGTKEKGEMGKITVSNRSKLSGGEDYRLARFTRRFSFIFFFFAKTNFSLLFPQCGAWAQTNYRGWLCLQGSTAFDVSTGNSVYTMVPDVLSVTIPY